MTPLPTYHKVAALVVADRRMLLVSSGMAPGVYSLPGGPPRPHMAAVTGLAHDLHAELGLTLVRADEFGVYDVVSNIDGAPVHARVFLARVSGEPAARQQGRRWRWADGLDDVPATTSARAVWADAAARGLVGPEVAR